jgi:inosose dehydratase
VIHLKDVEAAGAEHNVLLGTGIVNIPAVIRELKTQGFKGLVAIEYEKEGDVDADMERQIRYACQLV